ncbi:MULTISPECIES: class II aldolase/adducin family protein [unclassified Cupriavidus]|uniref:class II aldolase/adducin family protein n=1 Tax=unclassified Cupriavidus TaxID=2640874 RepID=UPI001055D078|nr:MULTISPECIES: class II aldolase/adducin family protein [unclassified Cupriavidus]MBF6989144.1 class II aldolase/adducin family protein [Cupriavidus sp. IK-TO18]TDF62149.1 class II aldolase/adducin family protein [Cupriavidus sp. L7L]
MSSSDLKLPSLRDQVSPEEWKARVDLAACYRLFDLYGLSDLTANHISARVPGENAFLINPYGMLYEEITASSLIKVDESGEILFSPDFGDLKYGVNRAGYVIHSAIHAARPDVGCVAHTHTVAGMAVSTLASGILPLTQTSMRFSSAAYHAFEGIVLDEREKESLLRDMGDENYLVLRNHGLLVATTTTAEAFNAMHRFEQVCKAQIAALACGQPLTTVPAEIVEDTRKNYLPGTRRPFGVMEWPAMLRKLDRIDPSYKG